MTAPPGSTTTASIFVPPRSIPPRRAMEEAYSGSVVSEQRTDELVEGRLVAAGDYRRREGAHGRGARDVHREGDLAEVVAGPEDRTLSQVALADAEHPREHGVEAISLLALDHGGRP